MSIRNVIKNFFVDDEYEYEYLEEESTPDTANTEQNQKKQNVVSLTSIQQANSKVVLCEPKTYNEVQEIADHIVSKRAVVINIQRVEHPQRKRIIDFLSGTVYAVEGDIQKLGAETFLCTPANVDVSGSITNHLVRQDEYEKGW